MLIYGFWISEVVPFPEKLQLYLQNCLYIPGLIIAELLKCQEVGQEMYKSYLNIYKNLKVLFLQYLGHSEESFRQKILKFRFCKRAVDLVLSSRVFRSFHLTKKF